MTRKILFSYFLVILVLVAAFVMVSVTKAGDCTDAYCDSDIQTVTTMKSQPYSVGCSSVTLGSAMTIYWSGSSSTVSTIILYVSTPTGAKSTIGNWDAQQISEWFGNYQPQATGTYTFILDASSSSAGEFEVARTSCNVDEPPNDAPSMVQAFTNSDSKIFINWKDNATSTYGSYAFVVQRMKATPNKPTSTSATPKQISFNSSVIELGWKDDTTSTPYNILIEKSTSTEFKNNCNSTKFHCSSTLFTSTFINNTNYYSDNKVSEATTYYYRIRACSILNLADFYPSSTSGVLLNSGDSHPEYACSFPTEVFSTTTPPNAPTGLSAQPIGLSSINLNWTKNSSAAGVYFKILRSGSYVATTTFTSFTDVGLSSCSEYTYEVKSCINKPNEICSTVNETAAATTFCQVNVSIGGIGKGSVTSTPTGINCPDSCSFSFPYDTGITLTALPDASSTFQQWNGITCSGNNQTATSCSFTLMSNVISATAIFATTTQNTIPTPAPAPSPYGVNGINSYSYINNSQTNLMASIVNSVSTFTSSIVNFGIKVVEVVSGKVNSLFENISSITKDSLAVLKKITISLISPTQTKGESDPYAQYFVGVTTTTQPFFEDDGLSSNTVYVYRVRVHYNDGRRDSDWSNWAAAKTLFDTGGNPSQSSTVCVANSVCRTFNAFQSSDLSNYNFNPTTEKSENQCRFNADCVNVGRINVLIKEK